MCRVKSVGQELCLCVDSGKQKHTGKHQQHAELTVVLSGRLIGRGRGNQITPSSGFGQIMWLVYVYGCGGVRQ